MSGTPILRRFSRPPDGNPTQAAPGACLYYPPLLLSVVLIGLVVGSLSHLSRAHVVSVPIVARMMDLAVNVDQNTHTSSFSPDCDFAMAPDSPPTSPEVRNPENGDSSSSLDGDPAAARPDLSYAHLAALAIDASCQKRCTVGEIYSWIETNYPYFKSGCPWWKVCSCAASCIF